METNSSNSKGYNDFQKQVNRCMKYTNLNSKIDSVQKNRFIKLFANSNEQYMFLILRVMNAYAFFVQMNEPLLNSNNEFRVSILNYIFDPSFFSQFYPNFSYNFYQNSSVVDLPTEDSKENDIDLISIDVEDEVFDIKEVYSPFDGSILLNRFFDLHFSRIDENIFYIAFYSYISNQTVPEDNYKEYSIYSQMNNNYVPYAGRYVKYIPIDERLLTFIDNVFTASYPTPQIIQNQINVFFTKNQYWSAQRKSIFQNYLQNWGIKRILQIKSYTKCTVHFNTIFYEWRMCSDNKKSSIVKLDDIQMALQINHFMPQSIEAMQMNFANNDTNCLDIGFFPPKSKTKKPNYTLIKKYIYYFTMNNASVLDNLALDFVNSVLKQSFSHKNTVICGDYDKYNKWINMFNPVGFCNTGLIAFYPYPSPIQTINLINHPDDEIEKAIRDNAKEVNIVRAVHKHILISSTYELPNKLKKYVNYIDFPYGGEFYNYEPLNDIDRLEIVKLLLVHGWHLLNSTEKPKESETKATIEILFDHLENTKETRIPLKVLYQIYQRFIDSKETMTGLRKYLQGKGYEYKTMDIRNSDKDYLQTLINQSEKRYLKLDIAPSDKQKAFSCKLDPEFWNAISPQRKKETEDKNAADFNEYLKELAEKYAPFFIEEEPEKPINDDPLAGFVPPEKFKDEDLQ